MTQTPPGWASVQEDHFVCVIGDKMYVAGPVVADLPFTNLAGKQVLVTLIPARGNE